MSEAIEQIRADYDSTPYQSFPFPQTAPSYLAAVAYLFGLSAPAVDTCRVLELGCASGGNILPLAIRYPKAHFVGIDLSPAQISVGKRVAAELGLDNIELCAADLTTIGPELGMFDYIICHGVFSWVPPEVQDAILRIASENLSPEGIAYVSYNTYPGWKAKEILRDAMILHAKGPKAAGQELAHARGMIAFLEEVVPPGNLVAQVLQQHGPQLRAAREDYLQHEFLEPFNAPSYFGNFVDEASKAKLVYLADTDIQKMFVANYGAQVAEPLLRECDGNQIRLEQYLDFVSNRTFRQTLLVHAQRTAQIRYQLDSNRLKALHVAAFLPRRGDTTALDNTPGLYGPENTNGLTLSSAVVKAAAEAYTARWPETLSFDALTAAVRGRLGLADTVPEAEADLLGLIDVLVTTGQAKLSLQQVGGEARSQGEAFLPEGWRRYAAATGAFATAHIANAWHETVQLNPAELYIVSRLDGTISREALVELVIDLAAKGELGLGAIDESNDGSSLRRTAKQHVDRVIRAFSGTF